MKERVSLRRMTAFFTSILLVVFCLPTLALPAKAETTVRQVNNIVLFAQFDPLTEKNFMSGDATNTVLSMCNDTTTYRSLTKYIDTISYGQMHVDSYFPQLKDGVIEPYVLSQSRESYTDYNQYAIEMIQTIVMPADIPLDGDNDGYIDNIVCLVKSILSGWRFAGERAYRGTSQSAQRLFCDRFYAIQRHWNGLP